MIFNLNKIKTHVLLLFIVSLFSSCNKEATFIEKTAYQKSDAKNILQVQKPNFKTLNGSKIGYLNGWYWFDVLLKPQKKGTELVFSIEGNTIDFIEVYQDAKKIIDLEKNIDPNGLAFKFTYKTASNYYFKVHFTKHVDFPIKVFYLNDYYLNKKLNYLKNGWYYGFVL